MKKLTPAVITLLLLVSLQINSQWVIQNTLFTNDLRSLWVIDTNTAYATTIFYVIKTTNGGTNWHNNLNLGTYFDDIQFINPNLGYLIGRTYYGTAFYRTTNAGSTWEQLSTLPVLAQFSMYFINANTGFAATFGGIYKTTNGGQNWNNLYGGPSNFTSVYFYNENTGWGTTDLGNIMKTSDAGISWFGVGLGDGDAQHNLFFINNNTGWIAADNSKVFKSTNSGWIPFSTSQVGTPNCQLNAVYFINNLTGWVVGCQGSIYRSNDGGLTWNLQTTGTTTNLVDIMFANNVIGWAVGATGRILRTTNGGLVPVMPISSEVPENFSLSQNYPNPFNPSTKIKFSIPKSGNAKLTVYDNQGKEMTKLLNEEIIPGIYEIEFNAVNFPSGVYFYNLVSGNYSETKKMVLVK